MVPIDKIKAAPKYARSDSWDWDNADQALGLDDYYGVVGA
jgi:hypothetical protein